MLLLPSTFCGCIPAVAVLSRSFPCASRLKLRTRRSVRRNWPIRGTGTARPLPVRPDPALSKMALQPIMYNGIQFAPVSSKNSIVVPVTGDLLWSVLGKFGRMALWMGSMEGQPIYTQLLVRLATLLPPAAQAVAGNFHL